MDTTCKSKIRETSLVVWWLTLCSPNAGGPGLIPDWGTRAYILQLRPGTAKYIKIYLKVKLEHFKHHTHK